MKLYSGIDLHSNNSVVSVVDETDKLLADKRLGNDLGQILAVLEPYREELQGIVVESTYNGYWLVDGLMEAGYCLHLANPAGNQQYRGIKHTDDRSDARWLANLLRLGILKEGYIYPPEGRAVRDLLRKRAQLVHWQTANLLSIQNQVARETGRGISANEIKKLIGDPNRPWPGGAPFNLAVGANLQLLRTLAEQIKTIERAVLAVARLDGRYAHLLSISGIGKVLGLTIMLETGDIDRFGKPGQFASYCRCVDSARHSNGKKKGQNNSKNGNRYLAWAFVEAANFAVRYDTRVQRFYERKRAKRNGSVAIKAVAHKLARAAYYIMRDGVDYQPEKAFA